MMTLAEAMDAYSEQGDIRSTAGDMEFAQHYLKLALTRIQVALDFCTLPAGKEETLGELGGRISELETDLGRLAKVWREEAEEAEDALLEDVKRALA